MGNATFKSLNLSNEILSSLEKLGFENPTEVQSQVIPKVLMNRDVIVKSQTGSGKTATFAIPVCENIIIEEKEPQALVLTPTRELALQVKEDITHIGRLKRVRAVAVFGKQPMEIQKNELKQRIHVVVGTPGRSLDHISRGNLRLANIKYLIIDEADEMLSMGFIDQVEEIIKQLPRNRVTMLFSATMPQVIESLAEKYMNNYIKVEINPQELTVDKIRQCYYKTDEDRKFQLLRRILYVENPDSCIMFCRTKENVERLFGQMESRGFSCRQIHGGMLQNDRIETMKKFKRGEFRFLVATDVAARGIDIESLTHVINYDVPLEKESYVHRIGRTGRAGERGKAITFVSPYEHKFLEEVQNYIGKSIPEAEAPSFEEVEKLKDEFLKKNNTPIKEKGNKSKGFNNDIMRLHLNAGKTKKLRAGDIVGAVSNIDGIVSEDIGIIEISDNHSYVEILNGKGNIVLEKLQKSTIKGKSIAVQRAKK